MTTISVGNPVPDFEAPSTDGKTVKLSELRGQNLVLYFYPKDSTPGCTQEACDFRDHLPEFQALNTVILGVSRDSLKSHENFRQKQCLPFDLLADPEEILCKLFDVIKMKNMYGKQVLGIERSTFLIDREGNLASEWRKVKVQEHVAEVLERVREISAG
ncbi:MAG: peroxiredoxin [Gammaproteobacteria bacterium]